MKRFILPALATTTAIAILTCGAPVQAATFHIGYEGVSSIGGPVAVTYDLTVMGDPTTDANGRAGYLLTSAQGTRNGTAIQSLLAPGDLFYMNDNLLFTDQPYLSFNGIGLILGGGETANIAYSDEAPEGFPNPFYYEFVGQEFSSFAPTLSVSSAVPEAATWAMMLVGFGAIGAAMRRGFRSGFAPGLV